MRVEHAGAGLGVEAAPAATQRSASSCERPARCAATKAARSGRLHRPSTPVRDAALDAVAMRSSRKAHKIRIRSTARCARPSRPAGRSSGSPRRRGTLADESFGLTLVWRDVERLGLHTDATLPFAVEHRRNLVALKVADHFGVEPVFDIRRQRSSEHDELHPGRSRACRENLEPPASRTGPTLTVRVTCRPTTAVVVRSPSRCGQSRS